MIVTIVYDAQCPVCRHVVAASRLRQRCAALELIDARTTPVDYVQGRNLSNLDFDEGFAVVVDGQLHHGADGARVLAVLTRPSGIGYRVFRWLVGGPWRARVFYPVLRAGRGLLLRILGVPRFGESRAD